jgi:hypothetical protein
MSVVSLIADTRKAVADDVAPVTHATAGTVTAASA